MATRQVTISGGGIKAELTVDVVGVNVSRFGRVAYGTGSLELGGVSYTAKSVSGFLGRDTAHHIHGKRLDQGYVSQRHVLRRGEAIRHGGAPAVQRHSHTHSIVNQHFSSSVSLLSAYGTPHHSAMLHLYEDGSSSSNRSPGVV